MGVAAAVTRIVNIVAISAIGRHGAAKLVRLFSIYSKLEHKLGSAYILSCHVYSQLALTRGNLIRSADFERE